jgi:hypothetical protein
METLNSSTIQNDISFSNMEFYFQLNFNFLEYEIIESA